jgi:16S rRNA C1402 N4-methylase RsmH
MKISDLSSVFCVLWGKSVDGILGDLGVSSHQFDVPEEDFLLGSMLN